MSVAGPTTDWDCRIKALAAFVVMTLGALAMLAVAVLTLFQAPRLYREQMAAPLGRWVLMIWGIRMVMHDFPSNPGEQRVYVSNHTSSIDMFILIALGLPNARFFLSGFLRKIPPIGIIGYVTGIFWTVLQDFPAERVKIFQRADRILRRSGESVYLSPEGERVVTPEVGHFNKGAFHLATSLRAPIVPFYIFIPPESDPGMGICAKPGRVDIYFKAPVPTIDWRLEDLVANKERIRNRFVEWHGEYHSG